jgi:MFS family permease
MAVSGLGFAALAVLGNEFLPLLAVLVGLSLGAEIDLIVFLTSRYFPITSYARTFGLLYSTFLLGVALSPAIYAALHQQSNNYGSSFLWSAACLAFSVFVLMRLPRYPAHPARAD